MSSPARHDRRRPRRRTLWIGAISVAAAGATALLIVWLTTAPADAITTTQATRAELTTSIAASGTVVDGTTTAITATGSANVTAIDGSPTSSGTQQQPTTSAHATTIHSVDVTAGQTVTVGQQLATVSDTAGAITTVTTPIAGTVRTTPAVVGAAATVVATIGSGGITAAVNVDEHRIASLRTGQQVDLDIGDGWSHTSGTVTQVGQTANTEGGVTRFQVLITPSSLPAGTRVGMTIGATITVEQRDNVITVPVSAVTTVHGVTVVTTVDNNGDQHRRRVTIGLIGAARVEIIRGLRAGERVKTGSGGSIPSETTLPGAGS